MRTPWGKVRKGRKPTQRESTKYKSKPRKKDSTKRQEELTRRKARKAERMTEPNRLAKVWKREADLHV